MLLTFYMCRRHWKCEASLWRLPWHDPTYPFDPVRFAVTDQCWWWWWLWKFCKHSQKAKDPLLLLLLLLLCLLHTTTALSFLMFCFVSFFLILVSKLPSLQRKKPKFNSLKFLLFCSWNLLHFILLNLYKYSFIHLF